MDTAVTAVQIALEKIPMGKQIEFKSCIRPMIPNVIVCVGFQIDYGRTKVEARRNIFKII